MHLLEAPSWPLDGTLKYLVGCKCYQVCQFFRTGIEELEPQVLNSETLSRLQLKPTKTREAGARVQLFVPTAAGYVTGGLALVQLPSSRAICGHKCLLLGFGTGKCRPLLGF